MQTVTEDHGHHSADVSDAADHDHLDRDGARGQAHDHGGHHGHGGHGDHAEMFRRRFWSSLLLSIPVIATSQMVMDWFGYQLDFPGIDAIGPVPDDRSAEGLGRLVAQLFTMRRMSISVAGMLTAGKEPTLESSIVKDLGTVWEQRLPDVCRDLAAFATKDAATRERFLKVLRQYTLISPKLTIQGGSTEILRGIIARGLGLR